MRKNKAFLILASIITVVLYGMGILTGVYINKISEERASQTELELSRTLSNISTYRTNAENIQLQQLFISNYQGELSCQFIESSLNQMQNDFHYFWSKLPPRLESYEKDNKGDQTYDDLKKEYTFLSIRAWLMSSIWKDRCNRSVVPTLYFYSADCERCVDQGEALDEVKKERPEFITFIVDSNLDEPIVKGIKNIFNVTEVPSLVIRNQTYNGYMSAEEIKGILSK